MKRMLGIAAALIMGTITAAHAQPFLVSASVDEMEVTGATGSFTVSVLAEIGFKASVYLSATAPTLPLAQLSMSPSTINAPYTDVATVTLTLTGPKTGGTHNIIIKGANGAAAAYDTVAVTIPNRSPWTVFPAALKTPYAEPAQFVLDKRNGIGWLAGQDSLKRFDGTTWSSYAWPREKVVYDAWPRGMTIDSSGVLWVVFKDAIFKRSDTSWTIIDTADASTGLTNDMVYSLADIGGQKYSCIHTAPDGTVWILGNWTTPGSSGVMSLWLLKYSGSTWTMYNQTNSQIPRLVNESEIITDSEGNVWIWSYATSLSKFDGTYWTHYDKMMLAGTDVIPFAADRNGYVWLRGYNWVIQFDGDSALYYYAKDFDNDDTTEIDTIGGEVVQTVEGSYIGRRAQALDIAPNGEVWVGLKYYTYGNYAPPGGVARLVDTAWYHYTIENSGLPNNNVVYLSVDDAGNPWILTQDGSLTILDGSAPPGSVFNEPTSSVPSVTGNQSYAGHITIMPNPASSQATLRLHLPTTGQVRLRVVNSLGQQVALLLDEVRSAGDYGISVPVDALPAGTYFVQFTGSGISETCPLIVSE